MYILSELYFDDTQKSTYRPKSNVFWGITVYFRPQSDISKSHVLFLITLYILLNICKHNCFMFSFTFIRNTKHHFLYSIICMIKPKLYIIFVLAKLYDKTIREFVSSNCFLIFFRYDTFFPILLLFSHNLISRTVNSSNSSITRQNSLTSPYPPGDHVF